MRKINVLFLPHPVPALATPWSNDVVQAIDIQHQLSIFDREQPAAPQFAGIEAIVDLGGNITPELLTYAAEAGVKFLQAQTTSMSTAYSMPACCWRIAPGSSAASLWHRARCSLY